MDEQDPLDNARFVMRFIGLGFAGLLAIGLGIFFLVSGDEQMRKAGGGALAAGVMIFGFFCWGIYRMQNQKPVPEDVVVPNTSAEDEVVPEGMTMRQLFILGLCLVLGSPLMYLYLQATVNNGAASAGLVLLAPLVVAGLGCMGISIWRSKRK